MFNQNILRILVLLPTIIYCRPSDLDTKEDVTIRLSPEHFHPIESLYHSQDKTGHYIYGYATPTAHFKETHSADGSTQGGYSYIDSNGKLQTVQYTADPLHGFRVAASNLPVESDDITHARIAHLQAVETTKAKLLEAARMHAVAYSNPIAVPYGNVNSQASNPVTDLPEVVEARAKHLAILQKAYSGHINALHTPPRPVQELPEVVKAREDHLAKFNAIKNRHEALRAEIAALSPVLDENNAVNVETHGDIAEDAQLNYEPVQYGPYSYGYVEPFSAKSETQSSDGVVTGGYSYIDAAGVLQTVKYVADKSGFRVTDATNIPVDKNHVALHSVAVAGNANGSRKGPVAANEKRLLVPAAYKTEILY